MKTILQWQYSSLYSGQKHIKTILKHYFWCQNGTLNATTGEGAAGSRKWCQKMVPKWCQNGAKMLQNNPKAPAKEE